TGLLFHLARRLADSRILLVGAYRPDDVAIGRAGARHPLAAVVHELQRDFGDIFVDLDKADGRAFVDAFLDSEPNRLDGNFRTSLTKRTAGNPLFTVEMLRGMQTRDELVKDDDGYWALGRELDWQQLPARVEAVIAERLDRLTIHCRSTLAAASVQGQAFLAEVAAEVQGANAGLAVGCLSETLGRQHNLVEAGSREHYGDRAVSRFRFRHYLIQQFAYQQLDRVTKSRLHEATGLALEELYADQVGEHALELARHFESAGVVGKAVDYFHQAGKVAYRISANKAAIDCFGRALSLLGDYPPGPERSHSELAIQLSLTAPLLATYGYTAPEIKKAANRAIDLAQQWDEPDYLFPARLMLLTHLCMRAEYQPAMELGEQLLKQAEREQNPLHLNQAHHVLGYLKFCLGSLHAALHHFDSALTSFDPQVESHLMPGFIGQNTWMTTLIRKAWTLWFLGYPDQSMAILKEIMSQVEQLDQDHDLAFTLGLGICPIFYIRGEFEQAEANAKRLLALATGKGLHYFVPFGQTILGSGMVSRGFKAEGLNELCAGIKGYREGGQRALLTFCLSILAASLGDDEEVGQVLDEATDLVEETGERFFEAELHRLRGEFLCQRGVDPTKVEKCYRQALDIARRQQAKSLELRAATSLARLWQRQGIGQEARQLLAEAYSWFTEGFETRDLKEARKLLQELECF
ncbi:MAG: hypothetical protein WA996_16945, partial [Candidatus Promineifilaceae bacterium]